MLELLIQLVICIRIHFSEDGSCMPLEHQQCDQERRKFHYSIGTLMASSKCRDLTGNHARPVAAPHYLPVGL